MLTSTYEDIILDSRALLVYNRFTLNYNTCYKKDLSKSTVTFKNTQKYKYAETI